MLFRMGAFVLVLSCLLGCAPLPPAFPQDTARDTLPQEPVTHTGPVSEKEVAPAVIQTEPEKTPASQPVVQTDKSMVSNRVIARPFPSSLNRPVRVGLSTTKKKHSLQGQGEWTLLLDGNRTLRLSPPVNLEVNNRKIIVKDNQGSREQATKLEVIPWNGDSGIRVDGKSYRGTLEFSLTDVNIRVVNVVSVEDYLRGVVPHEIGRLDQNGFEALKTQAVAARTYAYRHFGSRASQGFDVFADVRDQVYEGRDGEYDLANQAIQATRGIVMEYQGKLIDAYYHSTCSGHTESVVTWDRPPLPYLKAVPDRTPEGTPWCAESRLLNWEIRFTDQELAAAVQKNAEEARADKVLRFTSVDKIFILNRLPGGRVGELLISTDRGTMMVKGDRTRWLFKQAGRILPSANFDVRRDKNQWVFIGKGFGHGIGMCQMGARGRSRAGQSFREILWHYYTDIDLIQYLDP